MNRQKKGALLITVIGIIFCLSLFISTILQETEKKLEYRSQFSRNDELKTHAVNTFNTFIALLQEQLELGKKLSLQKCQKTQKHLFEYYTLPEEYHIEFSLCDESGKIPLNDELNYLDRFFEKNNISFYDNHNLIAEFKELRSKQMDTSAKEKNKNGLSKQKIRHFRELLSLPQWKETFLTKDLRPNASFENLTQTYSLWNTGSINFNSADKTVLELLESHYGIQFPQSLPQKPYKKIEEIPIQGSPAAIQEVKKLLTLQPRFIKINLLITRPPLNYYLKALLELPLTTKEKTSEFSERKKKRGETSNKPIKLILLTECAEEL